MRSIPSLPFENKTAETSLMGLEIVGITMDLERKLEVKLEDDDWFALAQNGDVAVVDIYEFLLGRLNLNDQARHDVAMHHDFWLEMRHFLSASCECDKQTIEMRTRLSVLFPEDQRIERWTALGEISPYQLPKLDYPAWMQVVGFLLAISTVGLEIGRILKRWPELFVFLFVGIGLIAEYHAKFLRVFDRWRTQLPLKMRTVKDLCTAVLHLNYDKVCFDLAANVDERCLHVWSTLRDVLCSNLNVEPEEVTFQTKLGKDLGV